LLLALVVGNDDEYRRPEDPDPGCWQSSYGELSFEKCCNVIFGPGGNSNCWGEVNGEAFTPKRCCAGLSYEPQGCEDFVQHFDFGVIKLHAQTGPLWQDCVDYMDEDPTVCITLSPHLVKYITCVQRFRKARQAGTRGRKSVRIAGDHYPTTLVEHTTGDRWIAPAFDAFVGARLVTDGSWNPREGRLLEFFVKLGDVVVDAGANLGGFAVPLARAVGPTGVVHAFEPFRHLFQLLTANVALNGLLNVHTHHSALGDETAEIPRPSPDLTKVSNPAKMHVTDELASTLLVAYGSSETIHVRTLDSFNLERVDLIKIDVESMEMPMLRGARDTIQRCRPVLYVEDSEGDKLPQELTSVMKFLIPMGYSCIDPGVGHADGGGALTSLLCVREELSASILRLLRDLEL